MKTRIICLIIIFACINAHAVVDYSFTYQGELTDNGSPAQGTYDIAIQAFNNVNATGSSLADSIHNGVTVEAGLFTIQQVDIGSSIFDGLDVWLRILVKKPADINYTALVPLQKMRSVPYANSLIDKGAVDGQVLTFNNVSGWQPANSSTDDQNISGSGLSGTNLTIGIEGGTNQTIDLSPLQVGGATKIDDLTDAKSDSDGTDDGSSVFIGVGAGAADNSSSNRNVGVGFQALASNTTGFFNTANGYNSLTSNTTGNSNTANGIGSLRDNTIGNNNTANGLQSLVLNTIGNNNTANGYQSLALNTEGYSNTSNGMESLYTNSTGFLNTASGHSSLYSNTEGSVNTSVGAFSLYSNTVGTNNTAIGVSAFSNGTNFSNSTGIGYDAEPGASNTIRLGNDSVTAIGGAVNWGILSDARFKTNIQEDVPGLEFIKKLRPVTYQLDMDAIAKFNKTPDENRLEKSEFLKAAETQTGFLAQEVEAAAQSLGYDFHGVDKPKNKTSHYGLRYAEFVVPLVKAVQELAGSNIRFDAQNQNYEVTTLQLQRQIEALKSENKQLKNRLDEIEQLLLEQNR